MSDIKKSVPVAKPVKAPANAGKVAGSNPAGDVTFNWRPIKTAPTYETILVAGGDAIYPVTACWDGDPMDGWYVDGQEDTHCEIGWPTHWMPLPAFPSLPSPSDPILEALKEVIDLHDQQVAPAPETVERWRSVACGKRERAK